MTIESKGNKVMPKGINLSKVGGNSTPSKKMPNSTPISTKKAEVSKDEDKENEEDQEKETANAKEGNNSGESGGGKDNEVPKGKISCLLCRGFISYKNSDR